MTAPDDRTPAPDPVTPPPATPARPRPGTEPTLPIRLVADPTRPFDLRRAAHLDKVQVPPLEPVSIDEPTEAVPVLPDVPPAGSDAAWLGRDQTLVGQAPAPAAPAAGEAWLGREQTMLPQAKGPGKEAWLGQEQTMVGAAPGAAGERKPAEAWLGREGTLVGMAAPGATGDKPAQPAALRKTTATMDDGWHLKGRQGPMTGQTMGDYEIGGILGEGGMGTVYRARQISLKRRVALKVLPPGLANDERLKERFEQEARTASLINSPHVVQVFAAGSYGGNVFFVMEFVEGTDLAAIIHEKQDAKQQFSPDEAASYVIQAARGLAEAGKHNIVHRDIKPPNLMVTGKGVLKIADFGISKVAGEHSLTMTGTAVGTPAYVSPEQGRGDQVDQRSDIYSLGIVFYELLTGQKPFDGTTANALIYQHNYTEPKLPIDLRADLPEAYQAVVIKCLQKDPAKRYQDAAELVADLEKVRAGSAPMTALMGAFGTGADEAMRRLGIRQRKLWPLVVAALLALALGGGLLTWWMGRSEQRSVIANEILQKRGNLALLDRSEPVTLGSRDDLTRLAELVPADDQDLVRWTGKLARLEALQARLARLDAPEAPAAALRAAAAVDLDAYKAEVGSDGEDVARWQGRLDQARAAEQRLREALAELDRGEVVPIALDQRLAPQLVQLVQLAGDQDADVKRWGGKLADGRERLAQVRARLAALDGDTPPTRPQLDRLDNDLVALRAMAGEQDAAAQGWAARIKVARDNLAGLRRNLARFDAVEFATTGLQAALKPDLEAYAALVEADDTELRAWQRKFKESAQRIAALRTSLARLTQPDPLTVAEQQGHAEQLAFFRTLVSPDDGQLQACDARLRAEREAIEGMTATLARLERSERLTVVEIEACAKALNQLGKLGGIGPDQAARAAVRLADERQKLAELRDLLKARETGAIAIDQELVERIDLLERLAGERDEEVKRWRVRVAEYRRLRDALIVLDRPAPLPERAAELLDAFAVVAGEANAEVRTWRAKLGRVAGLRQALASLDRAVPLPAQAVEQARALVAEVGEHEPQARRWLAKATRVAELIASLERELGAAYVLPAEAARQSAELVTLVGLEQEQVVRLARRVAVLVGPGKPAWAADAGRDQYGLWADLALAEGAVQRFRYLPNGSFTMGSPHDEPGRESDEPPVQVTLSRCLWLADSECTQRTWDAVLGRNDSRFPGPDRPVERVAWEDCRNFLQRLSGSVAGLDARLPTEAEWEYACRAGVAGPFMDQRGPVAVDKLETIGWFARNAGSTTKEVKRRLPNALGLFDMHGNVWEWCEDRYGTYSPTPVTDPLGREDENKVARGGSWGDVADRCRAANRLSVRADMRTLYLGFRMAVPVAWPAGKDPTDQLLPLSGTASVPSAPVADVPGTGPVPRP